MFGVNPIKIMVIVAVVLLLLGPDKLPEVAHKLGSSWRALKRIQERVESEVREALPDLLGRTCAHGSQSGESFEPAGRSGRRARGFARASDVEPVPRGGGSDSGRSLNHACAIYVNGEASRASDAAARSVAELGRPCHDSNEPLPA
jgi:TatA/E family protein of Tat protein translocase